MTEEISERFNKWIKKPKKTKGFRRNIFKNSYGGEISCPITIITPAGRALCVAQKYNISYEDSLSPYDGYLMTMEYEDYSYFSMNNVLMPLDVVFLKC